MLARLRPYGFLRSPSHLPSFIRFHSSILRDVPPPIPFGSPFVGHFGEAHSPPRDSTHNAAADLAEVAAQFDYGRRLLIGEGIARDVPAAVRYFERGAKRHHAPSLIAYGLCVMNNIGLHTTMSPVPYFAEASDLGDAEGHLWAAFCHHWGLGTDVDGAKAKAFCTRGANSETAIGLLTRALAVTIDGGQQHRDEVIKCYKRAVALGSPLAKLQYGLYLLLDPKENTSSEGIQHLKAAADHGILAAQRFLSFWFEMPNCPVGQDIETSTKYLRLAVEQCHVPSMYRLGVRLLATAAAEGVGLLKQAADFGMPDACLEYAWQLCRGHGTPKDTREARRYLDAAASSKVPIILFTAGRALFEGSVFDRDADCGMKMVTEAAELGLAEAQAYLGDLCLQRGEVARGEELLSRAASGGHLGARLYCGLRAIRRGDVSGKDSVRELASAGYVPAQRELGLILLGEDAGSVEGKRLLQDAAKAGDTTAQFHVARMMMEGPAAEKDLKLIEQYISNALDGTDIAALATYVGWLDDGKLGANREADATKVLEDQIAKGNPRVLPVAAVHLRRGIGGSLDVTGAAELCKNAADRGLVRCQFEYGLSALDGGGIERNEAEGFKYVKMAVDNGLVEGQGLLGWLYLSGTGTPKNTMLGFEFTEKAAQKGEANALFNLALCYAHGTGTEPDGEMAVEYLVQAAEAGSEQARSALDAMRAEQ